MTNVTERLQTCLTGERLGEFEAAKAILISLGVEESSLSVQRVMSAAFQALIGFHASGGELSLKWTDARYKG